MYKNIFLTSLYSCFAPPLKKQLMNKPYSKPIMEDGDNNIILQNRCGNRLTLMFKTNATNLEVEL